VLKSVTAPARVELTFVHITDTHFTEDPKGNAAKCATLFREIRGLAQKPAFVVHTGDVVEAGTPAEYALYQKALAEALKLPLHCAPGNHDSRWNPLGKEGFLRGTRQPLRQSWDAAGVHFVLLDATVLLEHWGHFAQDDLKWLAADLAATKGRPTVIGFHHPVGESYAQIDNAAAFLDVIRPHNVRLLLQGHGHADKLWSVEGIPAVMAKGLYQGSYNVVQIDKENLTVLRRTDESPQLTSVVTVPLKRPVTPSWRIEARVENGMGSVTALRLAPDSRNAIALPEGAQLSFRVDGGKPQPLPVSGKSWSSSFPVDELIPGVHQVTVSALLDDGREYQLALDLPLSAGDRVQPAWKATLPGEVQGHPSKDAQRLYFPTMDGGLVALNPRTGAILWKTRAGGPVFTTPLSDGQTVYFGSVDHSVYAVEATTGRPRWKFATQGGVYAGGALAKGVVCLASADQFIYGLDAQTGKLLWRTKGQGLFQSRVATDGQRFFIGGWDNQFRALDAKTGKVLWENKFGRSFYYAPAIGAPCVAEGRVYVTSNDGLLHAMDTATGKVLWETTSHSLGYSGPLVEGGKVYNASLTDEGKVFCFDAETGSLIWSTPTGSVIYDSSVILAQGILYIAAVDGTMSALQTRKRTQGTAEAGELLWQYRLPAGHVLSSPIAFGDRVAVGSLSGLVMAFPLVAPRQQAELAD